MQALIVGMSPTLMWSMPYLLSRSGFEVDAIATSNLLCTSRFVRNSCITKSLNAMLATAFEWITQRERPYDWVIACDDATLLAMSEMTWPSGREPMHFPFTRQGPSHIYSKIGLSQLLSQAGIRTPEFRVASGYANAIAAAHELGYPVYLKIDASSGGAGVFACRCDEDIRRIGSTLDLGPMLMQKKVEGEELDLSAVYLDSELVHFAYSKIERVVSTHGPSTVRKYLPLVMIDGEVLSELQALGKALNADGFVNIACMDAVDGSGRHYFEADMRPNAWVDFSQYYGEDAATRIRDWFSTGKTLSKAISAKQEDSKSIVMPHFQRVALWELMVNRYGVWKFIPWADRRVVLTLLWWRVVMPGTRAFVPGGIRHAVKRGMQALRIAFP